MNYYCTKPSSSHLDICNVAAGSIRLPSIVAFNKLSLILLQGYYGITKAISTTLLVFFFTFDEFFVNLTDNRVLLSTFK